MMIDSIDKTSSSYAQKLCQLKNLVQCCPVYTVNILNSANRKCRCGQHEKYKSANKELYHWIYEVTSFLNAYGCSIQQRIHWLLNGLDEFPKCIVCGKYIDDPH